MRSTCGGMARGGGEGGQGRAEEGGGQAGEGRQQVSLRLSEAWGWLGGGGAQWAEVVRGPGATPDGCASAGACVGAGGPAPGRPRRSARGSGSSSPRAGGSSGCCGPGPRISPTGRPGPSSVRDGQRVRCGGKALAWVVCVHVCLCTCMCVHAQRMCMCLCVCVLTQRREREGRQNGTELL